MPRQVPRLIAVASALVALVVAEAAQASVQRVPVGVQRIGATLSPTARINGVDERVDVDVAVVDTGVSPHEDLNVVGGVSVAGKRQSGEWRDRSGHGTAVAGVLGALDNELGVVGVAPGVRIYAVKAAKTDRFVGVKAAIRALRWIYDNRGTIDVVNFGLQFDRMSEALPGSPRNRQLKASLSRVIDAGIPVVAPAGNGPENARKYIPQANGEVITVSSFTDTDGRPGGMGPTDGPFKEDHFSRVMSNYGRVVDIAAPGTGIRSTVLNDRYRRVDGTSFAAPHVTGALALYLAGHPDASVQAAREALLAARELGHMTGDRDSKDEGRVNASQF